MMKSWRKFAYPLRHKVDGVFADERRLADTRTAGQNRQLALSEAEQVFIENGKSLPLKYYYSV